MPQSSLPRLIVTPSTPPPIFAFADDIALLPSQAPLYPSHTSHTLSPPTKQSRPRPHRSYTSPTYSSKHLVPPPHLPPPRSGHRPLRSPLFSIALLLVGLVLVASSVMCTSSQAEALLEMEQHGIRRLGDVGRGVGAKFGWDFGALLKEESQGLTVVQMGEVPGSSEKKENGMRRVVKVSGTKEMKAEQGMVRTETLQILKQTESSILGSNLWDFQ